MFPVEITQFCEGTNALTIGIDALSGVLRVDDLLSEREMAIGTVWLLR